MSIEKYVTVSKSKTDPIVQLVVGDQTFTFAYQAVDQEDALWYRGELCAALERLVNRENVALWFP